VLHLENFSDAHILHDYEYFPIESDVSLIIRHSYREFQNNVRVSFVISNVDIKYINIINIYSLDIRISLIKLSIFHGDAMEHGDFAVSDHRQKKVKFPFRRC
jgi:type II restriction/modification system DNA methylase subunit YeeA